MPAGRPTKYKKEFIGQGYKLAREGFTDKKIAVFFCISVSTLNLWKLEYPEFSESIQGGKDYYDSVIVEKAVLRRILGIKYNEKTYELSAKANEKTGKPELILVRRVTKFIPPDAGQGIKWLCNRQPDRWRDRTEMHLGGSVTIIAPSVNKPKNAGT